MGWLRADVLLGSDVRLGVRRQVEGSMTGFQAQMPGGAFVTTSFVELHDRAMARWNMVTGDGTVAGTGVSFATPGSD